VWGYDLPIRFDAQTWGRIEAASRQTAAQDIASLYRDEYTEEVAHLDDAALLTAIEAAQDRAQALGLVSEDLQRRFLMLDVVRAPGCWRDPVIDRALRGTSGSADTRFGDVCAMLKVSAQRAGRPDMVWW
jgi:hypothetical protein